MNRAALAVLALALAAGTAAADKPIRTYVRTTLPPGTSTAVSSNVIFLDRCPNGCTLTYGSDDSRTDHSSIGAGTLSAFNCGDTVWNEVMACMKDTFREFNVQITDVDPGTANHLEIKVAGSPSQINLPSTVGGIAPFPCASYIPNVIVFDFANVWGCSVEEMCSTAAQEIAHTWALDHVVDATDPMTYFSYSGRRYYHDSVQCGSDCVDGSGKLCLAGASGCHDPYTGGACSTAQTHTCACTSSTYQDDHATILGLFGPGSPTTPIVTIKKPLDGSAVAPGFAVQADIQSDYGVARAELRVDGNLIQTVTSSPYVFNAPDSLGPGAHTVEVTGVDIHDGSGNKSITAIIGDPCTKASDCPVNTDTCIAGRCVAGSSVPGGIGTPCKLPSDCLEGMCASDGTNMYCTAPCMAGECPAGSGCLPTGTGSDTSGVCWPNYNDGSGGGGGCATNGSGPVGLGLVLLGLAASRRRRRA